MFEKNVDMTNQTEQNRHALNKCSRESSKCGCREKTVIEKQVISVPKKNSYEDIRPQLSIKEACEILKIDLPSLDNSDSYDLLDLNKLCSVATSSWAIREDSIAVLKNYGSGVTIDCAVKHNAGMIIGDYQYRNTGAYSVMYPAGKWYRCIDIYTKLCEGIRLKYKTPVIAVTGNAGKTTTKDLLSSIFIREKNTLCVDKNYNTWYSVGEIIQNLTTEHEMYIQEVHEPHAEYCSRMLHPDFVILTNLERAHIDEMGASIESCINMTLGILKDMNKDGIIFANNDCKYLSKEKFDGYNVIRYSAYSNECDFWAEGIENYYEYTKFTIKSKKGHSVDIKLNISGTHNVNNAVAAFAVAVTLGIDPKDAVNAMSLYRPSGVRQNLIKKDDRFILVDCYSTTVLSSIATGEAFSKVPVSDGGRKIIVLSYLPTLGSESESVHRDVGRGISKLPVDLVLAYRNDAKYIVEECQKAGKEAVFFQYHKDLIEFLNKNLTNLDNVAFKGVTYSHLEQVANACLGLNIIPENSIEKDRPHNGGDF